MEKKQFKTIDEQLKILQDKGLTIADIEKTKDILLRENYFFIHGYRLIFYRSINDRRFIEGATFEELYSLFLFDRNIRNIFFKNILIVENNIKSIFSYELSKKYGYKEKDYLKHKNFNQDPAKSRQVNDLLRKMKRQIRINSKLHRATLHYLSNHGYIPLWVLVKVLSFGLISELYSILKPEDQFAIAEFYNLDVDNMLDYLSLLANYRNLCAHEDILYENKTQRQINDNAFHRMLNIPTTDGEYRYGKNDIFAVIIILKCMLTREEFKKFIDDVKAEVNILDAKVNSISLTKIYDRMGFPINWDEIENL
jgi:abortive infection bacteriophage resistance protein